MPEGIVINGQTRYRSGVVGNPNVSALGQSPVGLGILACVGAFPFLEPSKPSTVFSQSELLRLAPADKHLADIAHLIYLASADDRVSSPSTVVLVNSKTSTQAVKAIVDSVPAASMTLKATAWGNLGNRTHVEIANGTTEGKKLTVTRDGTSEVFDDVTYGNIFTLQYTGGGATTMDAGINPATRLIVDYTKTLIALGTYTPSNMAFDGAITAVPSIAPGVGESFAALITGVNKVTGLVDTETLAWPAADGAAKTSVKTWSSVATIVFSATAGVPTFTISGDAFNLSVDDYVTPLEMVNRINEFTGFVAAVDNPIAGSLETTKLDFINSASILAAPLGFTADTQAVTDAFNTSAYVTAVKTGVRVPVNVAGYLSGGTETAADATSWTNALNSLRVVDCDLVWVESSDDAVHKLLRSHCAYMCGNGANERAGVVGAPALQTRAALNTLVKGLNTRHLSMVFEQLVRDDQNGIERTYGPEYYALMAISMVGGMPDGTTLLAKRPEVTRLETNTGIKVTEDADGLIKSGLVCTPMDSVGYAFERMVTTYLTDNNPVYSEFFANRSLNRSIRDLRGYVKSIIGDDANAFTANRVRTIAKTRLEQQVDLGIIKAFRANTLVVEDMGAYFVVSYEAAVTEPTNFIVINPTIRRIPVSA